MLVGDTKTILSPTNNSLVNIVPEPVTVYYFTSDTIPVNFVFL